MLKQVQHDIFHFSPIAIQAPRGEEAPGGIFSEQEPRKFFSSGRVKTPVRMPASGAGTWSGGMKRRVGNRKSYFLSMEYPVSVERR